MLARAKFGGVMAESIGAPSVPLHPVTVKSRARHIIEG